MFRFTTIVKRFAIVSALAMASLLPNACSQVDDLNRWQGTTSTEPSGLNISLSPSPVPVEPDPAAAQPANDEWYHLYFTNPTKNGKASQETPEILQGLLSGINSARDSIDIAIYELNLEQVGEAILQASKRGVKVRMVTDSDSLQEDETLANLIQKNIEIVPDDHKALMHNKFMVVDGKFVWTGSWNFTFNDTYHNNNNAIYIQSDKLAKNYTVEFEEMFTNKKFGPNSPGNTDFPELQIGNSIVETCFAPEDHCSDHVINLIKGSQKSINFMAFSFTDNGIGSAMAKRAKAGVKVNGVFESRNVDEKSSEYAYLKKQGLDVHLDGNRYYMHHKIIIIDDRIVIMGSYNFTDNADTSNDENILVIYNSDIAAQYLEEFRRVYGAAN
jgi:phosphatidylserine/phosphatidylglycerophosphate/cardiolipin synthase-like enzyme